jgi:putative ubiquitin-RnfH superfamily antitoxin RatB of RatAB toxin-antitoxin module
MKLSVVYANEAPKPLHISLDEGATVLQAIEKSGVLSMNPDIDLKQQKVGVYGKFVKLDAKVQAGDRIEIYQKITRILDDEDDDE